MKICIGQTSPVRGDIEKNMLVHVAFIQIAINKHVDFIVFPELSLTGYEPELARQLATNQSDKRLDVLQELSDHHRIAIGVGLPTMLNDDIFISMVIFQPNKERITYSKQYLYPTEKGLYTAGSNPIVLNFDAGEIVAPAICYELSNKEHSDIAASDQISGWFCSK